MKRLYRIAAAVVAVASLAMSAPSARAADPYDINVILSLTGNLAFVGADQLQALKALEGFVNRSGGIDGRPLAFVVVDDASDPLRKLGGDATAAKIHDYLVDLRGWVGVNGTYDFRANPQRGLGQNNVIMVKFTNGTNVVVSKFGGVPVATK